MSCTALRIIDCTRDTLQKLARDFSNIKLAERALLDIEGLWYWFIWRFIRPKAKLMLENDGLSLKKGE